MDNASTYEGSLEEIASILSQIQASSGKYAVFGIEITVEELNDFMKI